MDGGDDLFGHFRPQPLAPHLGDAKVFAEQGLCGGRAEADEDLWLDDLELGREPRFARPYLGAFGFS